MIRFLIPTAKEMKASKEVSSQKLSEKSAAILTEMAKLSTDELSTAYKIKPEQAEKEKAAILEAVPQAQVIIMPMSPIIGIHTGPGVQAVIYFGNNR